jgi:hypothetical protein
MKNLKISDKKVRASKMVDEFDLFKIYLKNMKLMKHYSQFRSFGLKRFDAKVTWNEK